MKTSCKGCPHRERYVNNNWRGKSEKTYLVCACPRGCDGSRKSKELHRGSCTNSRECNVRITPTDW